MHFVDRHRCRQRVVGGAALHKAVILPVVRQIPGQRGLSWGLLGKACQRVGLDDAIARLARLNLKHVALAVGDAGDKARPDARLTHGREWTRRSLPAGKVADDVDLLGVGGPDRKGKACGAVLLAGMGAQLFRQL